MSKIEIDESTLTEEDYDTSEFDKFDEAYCKAHTKIIQVSLTKEEVDKFIEYHKKRGDLNKIWT